MTKRAHALRQEGVPAVALAGFNSDDSNAALAGRMTLSRLEQLEKAVIRVEAEREKARIEKAVAQGIPVPKHLLEKAGLV